MLSFDTMSSNGRLSNHSNPACVFGSLIASVSIVMSQTFSVFFVVSFASIFRWVRKCFARSETESKFNSKFWVLNSKLVDFDVEPIHVLGCDWLLSVDGVAVELIHELAVLGMIDAIICGSFVLVAIKTPVESHQVESHQVEGHQACQVCVVFITSIGAVFLL